MFHIDRAATYKVVQIWPGQTVTCLHTNRPGHIWTTLYFVLYKVFIYESSIKVTRKAMCVQGNTHEHVAAKKQCLTYSYVCAHARVGECVRTSVCVCVCVWVGVGGYTDTGVCLRACSLTNPICNAPPYCHLRSLWLHQDFGHYLTNGKIFGKK
jgi:hypothetical protein